MIRTRVGYAGGTSPDPTYRRIGDHMETVQVDFDPHRIGYDDLLEVFLSSHDPTWSSPARQYASAIFTHDQEQETLARKALGDHEKRVGRQVSTLVLPYSGFTRAEDYHQKYYLRGVAALASRLEGMFADQDAFTDSTAVARVNGYLGGNGSAEQLEKEAPQLGLGSEAVDALRRTVEGKRF